MVEIKDEWLLAGFTVLGATAAVVAVVLVPGVGVFAAVVGPSMSTSISGAIMSALVGSSAGVYAGVQTIEGLRGEPPTTASVKEMGRLYQEMSNDLQLCRTLVLSAAAHCDGRDDRALRRKLLKAVEAVNPLGQASQVPDMADATREIIQGRIGKDELERALEVMQPARATCQKMFHAVVRVMTDEKKSLTVAEADFLLRLDRLNVASGGGRMCKVDVGGRVDILALMMAAEAERKNPIQASVEDPHLMDVFPDRTGRTPGERVVQQLLSTTMDEATDHERWIEAFRELALHGGMTRAPWRHRRPATELGDRIGSGLGNVRHGVLLRTGVEILTGYLRRLDRVATEVRGQRLGVKARLARYREVSLLEGTTIRSLLTDVGAETVGVGALEIGHQLLDFLDVAQADVLAALRCATHAVVDGFDALLPGDMTANERGALFLNSLLGAGIIVGTELIERRIHHVVCACLPPTAKRHAAGVTWILTALGMTAAMFVVSKAVDGALAVDAAKRREEIEHKLAKLTGREINDRNLILFRAKVAARAKAIGTTA